MTDVRLFDYDLPEELIAQYPAEKRDASRLLVVDRASGVTEDRLFSDLPEYLRAGDVLVLNDSRVIRARLIGVKERTGARIEIFLVRRLDGECGKEKTAEELWEALARPAKRLRIGGRILFGADADNDRKSIGPECGNTYGLDREANSRKDDSRKDSNIEIVPGNGKERAARLAARILSKNEDGSIVLRFEYEGRFSEILDRLGHIPLPPYIRREDEDADSERYQTVYAKDPGSAAAPTAGLHFTDELLAKLRARGVETVFVTLHVGPGTFRPVQTDVVEDHRMHEEYYHIGEEARRRINKAKADGRRIICVGTTSVRTIESAGVWDHEGNRYLPGQCGAGSTDIFLYPGGREFFMTDGLITNFHLPKSTLFMLVSAFAGRERMLEVYREAIANRYRFFSYGDAMLIL